jgi:deoxyribonuclease-4
MTSRLIGAHTPVAGGLANRAIPYAETTGARVLQLFVANPRGWALPAGLPAQDRRLREWSEENGVPLFIHAPYLINLGSAMEATAVKSLASLQHSLDRGRELGVRGVVYHAGSSQTAERRSLAFEQVREGLLPILEALTEDHPDVLVEPTAGGGSPLASRVEDLTEYFEAVDRHPRMKVCLDTCHAFAAGHDLSAPGGLGLTLLALDAAVGIDRLALVHVNDSKDPLASSRDRHERLGQGYLGTTPFAELFTEPLLEGVPLLVETPTDDDGTGHATDIAYLHDLAAKAEERA